MPARTRCLNCQTTGFVRSEHVIVGGRSVIQYYCGRCEYTWTIEDEPPSPAKTAIKNRTDNKSRG